MKYGVRWNSIKIPTSSSRRRRVARPSPAFSTRVRMSSRARPRPRLSGVELALFTLGHNSYLQQHCAYQKAIIHYSFSAEHTGCSMELGFLPLLLWWNRKSNGLQGLQLHSSGGELLALPSPPFFLLPSSSRQSSESDCVSPFSLGRVSLIRLSLRPPRQLLPSSFFLPSLLPPREER